MPPDTETLLQHAEGLRRLVRGLVYCDAEVEDVVQDTLLAAMRRTAEPRDEGAWLRRVARNLASNLGRSEGRRRRRERAAARPESLPGAATLAASLDEKERLLQSVRRLAEPYREAIILRYFEGLPPREIVARRGLPVNTVKTHLQRGLAALRAELDRAHEGSRRRWHAALLPLATGAGSRCVLTATAVGGLAVKKTLLLAGLVLIVLAGAAYTLVDLVLSDDEDPVHGTVVGSTAASSATPRTAESAPGLAGEGRSPGDASSRGTESANEPATLENSVHGRIVDLDGKGVSNVRIRARAGVALLMPAPLPPGPVEVRTDADGRFLAGPLTSGSAEIEATKSGYVGVTRRLPNRGARLDLVLEPAGTLLVEVFGPEGRYVSNARVRFQARRLDRHAIERSGRTDAKGRLLLEGLPIGRGVLSVESRRHALRILDAVEITAGEREHQAVILSPRRRVEGRVLRADDGRPVGAATVRTDAFGYGSEGCVARTNADGSFAMLVPAWPGARIVLRAEAPGFSIGVTTATADSRREEPVRVELPLEAAAPLRGTVLTPDGSPAVRARVGYHLGHVWKRPEAETDAEGRFALALPGTKNVRHARMLLVARHPLHGVGAAYAEPAVTATPCTIRLGGRGEVRGRVLTAGDQPAQGAILRLVPLRQAAGGTESEAFLRQRALLERPGSLPGAVSDAKGEFVLGGVPAGSYRIDAVLGEALTGHASEVSVGRGQTARAVIELGPDRGITGRVVDQHGQAVAGLHLQALAMGPRGSSQHTTYSRADGTFVLRGLDGGMYTLLVMGDGFDTGSPTTVPNGTRDVRLQVKRGVPLAGQVLFEGKPWRGVFTVVVEGKGRAGPSLEMGMVHAGPSFRWVEDFSAGDGRFSIAGLPPGDLTVRINTPDGLESAETASVSLSEGTAAPDLRFTLTR